jgi:hypothetical protein
VQAIDAAAKADLVTRFALLIFTPPPFKAVFGRLSFRGGGAGDLAFEDRSQAPLSMSRMLESWQLDVMLSSRFAQRV